jgi:hypothetical protein
VKEENSINSRHGRRVAKKLVVVLAERVRKVDGAAADGRESYGSGAGAGAGYEEIIEEMNEREGEIGDRFAVTESGNLVDLYN